MTEETKPHPWERLRFKEIVVSNAAEVKHRESLLRLISARLGVERRKLLRTEGVEKRNRVTYEIKRLQELRTQLRQSPAIRGADHPKVRAAIRRHRCPYRSHVRVRVRVRVREREDKAV